MASNSQTQLLGPSVGVQQPRRPLTRARTASEFQTLSSNTTTQTMPTAEVHSLLDSFSKPRGLAPKLHPLASQSVTSLRPTSRDTRSSSEPTQWPLDRSEGLARSLLAKSSLLLRRKTSKAALASFRAIEWDEEHNDRVGSKDVQELSKRRRSKHGRHTSTNYESMLKTSISDPYDFQHLTHTSEQHAKALQTATQRSQNELVSEFSAIRASQAARKELRGIKADNIVGGRSSSRKNSFSQSTNAPMVLRTAPSTPSFERELNYSPISHDEARGSPVNIKALRMSSSADNFSRINPRSFNSPSPPRSPPARRSSKSATNLPLDAIGKLQSPSKTKPIITREGVVSPVDVLQYTNVDKCISVMAAQDLLNVGNAVSTPDNSAYTLRPQMSSSSIALADVPEEEEATLSMRQSMQGLGLTMSRKHWGSSTTADMTLHAPQKHETQPELVPHAPYQAIHNYPNSPDAFEAPDTRSNAATQTDADLTTSFTDSWEDDIDYCYDHAAEADCAFDWDRMSVEEREPSASDLIIEEIIDSAASTFHHMEDAVGFMSSPVTGSQLDLLQPADPQPYVYTYLDPSHIKAPSQSRSPLSASSSTIFASEAPTPYEATSFPNLVRRYERESGIFPTNPSLLTPQDYESRIVEESTYAGKGPYAGCEDMDSTDLPLYEPRFPIDSLSCEESLCGSSHHPLSKCSSCDSIRHLLRPLSHESMHGNTSSIGSLPELVHSSRTLAHKTLAEVSLSTKLVQMSDPANATETPTSIATLGPNDGSQNTTAPMPSGNSTPDALVIRERSLSECSERALSPSDTELDRLASASSSGSTTPSVAGKNFAGRMRSASAATTASGMARKSRVSYSLFPSVPVPGPR